MENICGVKIQNDPSISYRIIALTKLIDIDLVWRSEGHYLMYIDVENISVKFKNSPNIL